MKLTYDYFEKRFQLLEANFGFKTVPELLPLIFEQLKALTKEQFDSGFNSLMAKTRQEWSELYDYGKTPTVADWQNLFGGKRRVSIEEVAKMEIEKILHEARYSFSTWKPENEITLKVLDSFANGLSTIHFELFDSWNDNKKSISFFRKDLVEKWLAYYNMKDEQQGNLQINQDIKKLMPNFKTLAK